MILKNIFKVMSVLSLMTFSLTEKKKNDCKEIENYLDSIENIYHKGDYIGICKVNDKGKVIELDLESYDDDLSEENLLHILQKYNTFEILSLDKFDISQKSLDIIKSYPNLTKLSIDDKVDGSLNFSNGFKKLTSLTLSLYYYNEATIPEIIYSFKKLEKLRLINYKLSQKDIEGISKLTNLKELEITQDVDSDGDSADVEKLDLNPLKKLTKLNDLTLIHVTEDYPEFINSLSNIKSLTLVVLHGLKTIPDSMLKLESLEYLNLNNNEISEIPDNIKNLKNLKTLELVYNKITKFSDALGSLKNLEILYLIGNEIDDKLPESLNNLTHLKEIYLGGNINIKGRTLTNKSLENCSYDNYDYDLCLDPKSECINIYYDPCKDDDNKNNNDNKISTDGKCGKGKGKCPNDKCCSKYGWCGIKEEYCSLERGCQSEFGQCNHSKEKISTNDKCGIKNGKCPDGKCCSKYGWCGTNEKYCSLEKGCQIEFGKCNHNKEKISTNDKCGTKDGKCPDGKCCSKYGWCGKSDDYCGRGCQSQFGKCN